MLAKYLPLIISCVGRSIQQFPQTSWEFFFFICFLQSMCAFLDIFISFYLTYFVHVGLVKIQLINKAPNILISAIQNSILQRSWQIHPQPWTVFYSSFINREKGFPLSVSGSHFFAFCLFRTQMLYNQCWILLIPHWLVIWEVVCECMCWEEDYITCLWICS